MSHQPADFDPVEDALERSPWCLLVLTKYPREGPRYNRTIRLWWGGPHLVPKLPRCGCPEDG